MSTLQISLPETANRFIEEQIAAGRYATASEYVLDLVERARVQAAKEKLTELIREGMESGEGVEYSDDWWDKVGAEIREEAERRGFV